VTADARSIRQIVRNLIDNSTRFAGAGGQVIVTTTLTDLGEVVLRVRDSGTGMSEQEIALAMAPFRQVATAVGRGPGGSGLGLPLAKALAEANRATFRIKSEPDAGTLIEVAFPPERVVASERP
jgi:signal transduction histidine kinase